MKRLLGVLTLSCVLGGNAFAATEGVYIEAIAKSTSQNCEDVWKDLKSYNWPNLNSLMGAIVGRHNDSGEMICVAKKTLYGPESDLLNAREEISKKYQGIYNIKALDIHKTRYVGQFSERSGNFKYEFDRHFDSFSEMIEVADWHSWSCGNMADCFRKHFGAEDYANQIQQHFNQGNCLKDYGQTFRVFALDENGQEIATVASRYSVYAEICDVR